MRVLVAARLSKLVNGQTGLDTQDAGSRAWAEQHGHTVVAVVPDRKSGVSDPWDRPKLRPWVTDPNLMAQYEAIVAFDITRLSRGDDESTSRIEDWAREHGKQLLTVDGLYYPCEGADGIRWDVMKRLAHQEWLSTSERYRRMQKHLRDNGFHAGGRIPFGFQLVKVDGSEHKTLAPDPVTGDYVRQAVGRYLSGDSLRTVCAWLDGENIKPWTRWEPGTYAPTWSPGSLKRVFINSALYGRTVNGQGKTVLRHEGIISHEIWDKLQDTLHGRANHRGATLSDTAMLTNVIVCARCDGPMYRHNITRTHKDGSKRVYRYYRCHGSERSPSRCGNMVSLTHLDEWTESAFRHPSSGLAGLPMIETVVIPGHGHDDEIAEIERDIRELDMDIPDYLDRVTTLRAERARLKALLTEDDQVIERETGETLLDRWAVLNQAGKREFLMSLGITVHASREDGIWMTTSHTGKALQKAMQRTRS
jgi:DNA invertase Pin-like site-specific DNA recombinase